MPKCVAGCLLLDQLHPKRRRRKGRPPPLARLLLLLAALAIAPGAMARKLADIRWHSNNSIFDRSSTEHVKRVQLLDRVTLLCPEPGEQYYEHSKLFMVPREAYELCVLRGGERQLGVCSSPERQSSITLVFREFSPLPSAFTFRPGHSYFVITTSNGSLHGLNNTQGGLCAARNMRLKFDILESASEENDEEQPQLNRHKQQRGHHQQGRHSPAHPKEQSGSQDEASALGHQHPPFLYVIHTADTPREGGGEEDGGETAAWGQHLGHGQVEQPHLASSALRHKCPPPALALLLLLLLPLFPYLQLNLRLVLFQ